MNQELSSFAARLRGTISDAQVEIGQRQFPELALELFALQFDANPAYRKICEARRLTPRTIGQWTQIPFVPTSAFKELELSCLPPAGRTAVFHSSGTTEHAPSRHFHNAGSLAVYEASLWAWFARHVAHDLKSEISNLRLVILTPPPTQAPHSSLVHMFETVRRKAGAPESAFVGESDGKGTWTLDFDAVLAALDLSLVTHNPVLLLGTAFSYVHLLDFLAEKHLQFKLPGGSRTMETGGYKNRSRVLPKTELHTLIAQRLGVSRENIICEYGMSELSSQAYDNVTGDAWQVTRDGNGPRHASLACRTDLPRRNVGEAGAQRRRVTRHFHFPPWAQAQIISPETGREVAEGETGLIRVFDLANVFSVAAVQTEDLGIRHGEGFELIGRTQLAEPRGCSLMTA